MAKKDKKPKVPKSVGGVKLPKQLRKSAGVVAEIAQNPVAREVVSAALVAGASALAKRKVGNAGATSPQPKKAGDLDTLISQGKEIGNILAQGVTAFFGELLKPAPKKADTAAASAPKPAVAPHIVAAKPATAKPASARPAAAKPAAARPATTKPAAAKPAAAKRAPAKPRAAAPAAAPKARVKPGPKPKA